MDDFEKRMDKFFEQENFVTDNTARGSPEVKRNSIYNKQIGLKTSIGIMGSVLALVGYGVYYLVVVMEVTK